jgi:hypothetical protein
MYRVEREREREREGEGGLMILLTTQGEIAL